MEDGTYIERHKDPLIQLECENIAKDMIETLLNTEITDKQRIFYFEGKSQFCNCIIIGLIEKNHSIPKIEYDGFPDEPESNRVSITITNINALNNPPKPLNAHDTIFEKILQESIKQTQLLTEIKSAIGG